MTARREICSNQLACTNVGTSLGLILTSHNRSYAPGLAARHLPQAVAPDRPNTLPSPCVCLISSRIGPRLLFRRQSFSSPRLARHRPRSSIQSQVKSIHLLLERQEIGGKMFRCCGLAVAGRAHAEKRSVSGEVEKRHAIVREAHLDRARSWPLWLLVG